MILEPMESIESALRTPEAHAKFGHTSGFRAHIQSAVDVGLQGCDLVFLASKSMRYRLSDAVIHARENERSFSSASGILALSNPSQEVLTISSQY